MPKLWKKGRGKLGFMDPLLGHWAADWESPMGPVHCTRSFERFGGSYIRLDARWEFGAAGRNVPEQCDDAQGGKVYEELALYGAGPDGKVAFVDRKVVGATFVSADKLVPVLANL